MCRDVFFFLVSLVHVLRGGGRGVTACDASGVSIRFILLLLFCFLFFIADAMLWPIDLLVDYGGSSQHTFFFCDGDGIDSLIFSGRYIERTCFVYSIRSCLSVFDIVPLCCLRCVSSHLAPSAVPLDRGHAYLGD